MRWMPAAVVLVAATFAADAAAQPAPTCVPGVLLAGEPRLVERVAGLLADRGVALAPTDCGATRVELRETGDRIAVVVDDPDDGRIARTADDPVAAATVVESFVRRDLVAPLMAARDPSPVRQVAAPEVPPEPVVRSAEPAPPRRAARPIAVMTGLEAGVSSDRALWTSLRVGACVKAGPVCVGGMARFASDTSRTGRSSELGSKRGQTDLLFLVDVPIELGAVVVTPGGVVGQTGFEAERMDDDEIDDETSGLRFGPHIAGSYRLADRWSIRIEAAAELWSGDRTQLGRDTGEPELAPVPRLQTWLGFGLVYGGL